MIFSVKEWCDLENRVRVRSRSLEMAPFDRSHMWVLLALHSNYGTILYRLPDIVTYWSKIAKFLYFTCIYRPRTGWPHQNLAKVFDADKTRMIGLPCSKKSMTICWAVFIQYQNVTDRHRFSISILRVTRHKNHPIFIKNWHGDAHFDCDTIVKWRVTFDSCR